MACTQDEDQAATKRPDGSQEILVIPENFSVFNNLTSVFLGFFSFSYSVSKNSNSPLDLPMVATTMYLPLGDQKRVFENFFSMSSIFLNLTALSLEPRSEEKKETVVFSNGWVIVAIIQSTDGNEAVRFGFPGKVNAHIFHFQLLHRNIPLSSSEKLPSSRKLSFQTRCDGQPSHIIIYLRLAQCILQSSTWNKLMVSRTFLVGNLHQSNSGGLVRSLWSPVRQDVFTFFISRARKLNTSRSPFEVNNTINLDQFLVQQLKAWSFVHS
ncbi:hypothetical protein CLUG_01469 [Clavispora lusitaniae ATCC 42720]|uniref:Uncharacterized protein n=1 Tax=Clavispora lusitaniae (strain ATCC 42720) TaxID=306902 RepID=C4XZT7_CLAL4|nr:uncharacterized protein CLUG_01469 [Clavispora lusitaniae ATCC 42720]EEQ37345.1 hypothetical protein CLUG_01469 [Clavispora lusitaniae ATCC 42720]